MDSEDTRARSVGRDVEGDLEGRDTGEVDGRVVGRVEEEADEPAEEPAEEEVDEEPPDAPVSPGDLSTGVRSVSAAREVDGARAWESSDRLARLALLVTGSPDRAYGLTRETLISVGRSGPYVQARRKLLRQAVRTRVDGYATGLLPGMAGPTPGARLWRRLMRLPAVERALVVLTEAEGMADAVAGAVLGLPRVETEQTLTRVRASLEAHAQLTEAERREVFDGPALMPDSAAVPTQALARAQRGRRLRRVLAALATVVVLAGASLAVAVTRSQPGDEPVRNTATSPRSADPARWSARGDLLGNGGLLRASVRVWQAKGYGGVHAGRPAVLWAGRLTGGRRLVVLAGRKPGGDRVLGVLLDRGDGGGRGDGGDGLTLVRTLPSVATPALDLGNIDRDAPDSRRYLVAPRMSALGVNDVDGQRPTGAQRFSVLGLHDGLSEPWARQTGDGHCTRPLIQVARTDIVDSPGSGGTGNAEIYALDAAASGPTALVTSPPESDPARAAYFQVLHGLVGCVGGGGFHRSLVGTTAAARGVVSRLAVTASWNGRLPDHSAGRAFRLTWRVDRPPAAGPGPGADDGSFGRVFALVTGDKARFSTVRFGAGPADDAVDGVAWFSSVDRRGYVFLMGGPGVSGVDLQPRPKGFRVGHPVASPGLPGRGRKHSVVGLDRAGRPVSVQPLDF